MEVDLSKFENLAQKEKNDMIENPSMDDLINQVRENTIPVPTMDNVTNQLGQFTSLLNEDPEKMEKIISESFAHITPEMRDQAARLIKGGQGQEILKQLQKRGINHRDLRRTMKKNRKGNVNIKQKLISVIHVTSTRQVRTKQIPEDLSTLDTILKTSNYEEISCENLAKGPLENKEIKLYYNPEVKTKNRRVSKIVGPNIGGDVVIIVTGYNISEKEFLAAEKLL